ncbi:hypothetical protein NTE_01019 [Candidatus Nitrososphaera evergladensis SR1]|uniref:Uncharacterized protein n=1 Tax=Candidatus Nitrososphaera evergladensis SR1 TaxID=1459636 RepID=A0A075MPF0_9ARCH|nr:hypothetical protein NTE_01019 [Candidatus Nitrososphaera evergladensis SR1]
MVVTTTAAEERPPAFVSRSSTAAREKPFARANFLVCNSCLWCASGLGPATRIDRCPGCGAEGMVEALPILSNETYRVKKKAGDRGVELDFTTTTTTTLT